MQNGGDKAYTSLEQLVTDFEPKVWPIVCAACRSVLMWGCRTAARERGFFIDNLLVRVHSII